MSLSETFSDSLAVRKAPAEADAIASQYTSAPADLCGELHNRPKSYGVIEREQPEHRTMLYLAAAGHDAREIAGITGYSYQQVRKVMSQDWFQRQYTSLLLESGKSAVDELLNLEAAASVNKLIFLRDEAKSEAVQYQASVNLLDRIMGKPIQKSEVTVTRDPSKAADTIEKLDEENNRLEAEIERLSGRGK